MGRLFAGKQTATPWSHLNLHVSTLTSPAVKGCCRERLLFSPSKGQRLFRLVGSLNGADRQTLLTDVPVPQLTETRPSLARSWNLEMKETRALPLSVVCRRRPVFPPQKAPAPEGERRRLIPGLPAGLGLGWPLSNEADCGVPGARGSGLQEERC